MDGGDKNDVVLVNLDRIRDQFIHECQVLAPVGLWELIMVTRTELCGGTYTIEPEDLFNVRRTTMTLVERLLRSGSVRIFGFDDADSFLPWDLPIDESIQRINQEWDALGQEPDNGLHPVAFFVHNRPKYQV